MKLVPCSLARQKRLSRFLVEQPQESHAVRHPPRSPRPCSDVVDPGHVLVSNSFDPVCAEAVAEQRGALQRLGRCDLPFRVTVFFLRKSPAAIVPADPVEDTKPLSVALAAQHLLEQPVHGRAAVTS